MNDFAGRMSSMVSTVFHRTRIPLLLAFTLLAQSAWAQRIGPLVPDNSQRPKASSAERKAAVRPPSLQLSLPSPAEVALPPLGPDDLQRLQPQQGRPPVIGVHRRLPEGALKLSFSGGAVKSTAEGAWRSTEAGRLWRLKMTSPKARAMRVHFRDFAIGAGSLWLHSADGQTVGPYSGSGLYDDGDFWSGIVFGDSLTIEYLPDPSAAGEAVPFQIVAISHIWGDAFGDGAEGSARQPEAAWGGAVKALPGRIDLAVGTPSKKARLTKAAKAIPLVERSASLQPLSPKAARPLTPGEPVSFSRGPVDSPAIFIGDSSYQLEVPEDASRVTFTLESVDPDVDVDLYVRFGEDNDVQNGRIVSDYSSEGLTGNEEIVITPQSDPPLRAGTYFVSISVFDTGVVANCTLTAEVEREGGTPPPTSGRTLTPGQPVTFQRGPVDNPKLFFGTNSFRLEVPEDASRVTFTLESDVDVELAVRYGEDNAVEDRMLVTDHRDRNPAGNEEVVITPQSVPPLRAGTYFVSVAVYATGVVANCTLTAEVEREGEAQPTISGGTLTPGQPADFRLGPVDSPLLFNGPASFQLEVPEAASRITFTLESVDPDVDVDLFVRFGEDNTIQDGELVSDHFSLSFTGNERIGITRRSDPPLRAGTYFVSILVFDTGAVAEGTLTATVETDAEDCHLDVTCYPEWSSSATGVALMVIETDGGSFACSGTLLNNSRQDRTPYFLTAAHCVQTEEEARSVTALWSYQTRTCNGDLPDLRSVPRTEGAGLLSTLGGAGYPDGDMTLLQLEGDLPDAIVFQGWDADPQPVGAQVTGIHHPGSADWGRFKRISFGQIIPDPGFGVSDDTYFVVSWPVGQGYTEPGSSGSAVFSSAETVVGALSGGDIVGYSCPTEPVVDVFTHFSVFYPHIRPFIDSTLPEITGGALPPGQPAGFRLGPVDAPMLFSGDSSFQVEVPEGAARVTFTLESVDPDVNVDLYVRYGEDNAIQGGNVVSDYSSTGPTGNEQIVVTRQSDPPLRAGTYYVSLMLRTTGAVAEVTLTAEFDAAAPPPAGGQTYYFPHLAVGASWQTTITYINYSSQEVSCQTDFLSDQGTPLMVSFPGRGRVSSRPDVLPPGGSVHEETDVELSAPYAPGWARAACSGPVKASLLFRQYDSEGVAVAEAGVNAAAVAATRFVTFAEQAAGQPGTGVAYANPSATAEAVVTFTARDAAGDVLDSVDERLLPGGHDAKNMQPLFGLPSFTGSLEVTSTQPIVSLSINAEAAPVFSSLPPGELDPSAQGPTTYYFPHLAVGAGWQTTITYINYSAEEVSCRTDFLSDQGTPLLVSFPGRATTGSRTDFLPPGGSVHEETNVGLSALLQMSGWARAACTGPVKASLLFRQYDSAGLPTGEAGVNAAAVPATRFVTFAERAAGQAGTAVAYANPSATAAAVVTFTAKDEAGRTLDSFDQTLMPGGYGAKNMVGLFSLSSFSGSLEITSTAPIVTLSLNAEAAPVFSSLPPGEIVDPPDIPVTGAPDLVVQAPSLSPGSPNAGESFTLSATVRNQGNDQSASTTLRYYLSTDAAISTGDTEVGTDTVGGLSASGSDDVSIGLTAPSTVGTYYYGACVDPVSGESDAGNNCSSAVRVIIGTGQIAMESFDLDTDNSFPRGIAFANDKFYVVDGSDDKVYAYRLSGQRDSASDFDLDSDNADAEGITFANNRFYVVDDENDKVYVYQASGQRDSASDFDLDSANAEAQGITFANNRFYVVDRNDKVYAYQVSGQRDSASDFDLDSDDFVTAQGITFANNRFYVVDWFNQKVYVHQVSGQRDSASDFDLFSDNTRPTGITFANDRFYVPDWLNDKVYVYQASGQRDSASDFDPDPDDDSAEGITIADGRVDLADWSDERAYVIKFHLSVPWPGVRDHFSERVDTAVVGDSFELHATVRNRATDRSTATTLRYYRSADSMISSSADTQVGADSLNVLSRAAISAETITLTAPTTAGTWCYGACVDLVSRRALYRQQL